MLLCRADTIEKLKLLGLEEIGSCCSHRSCFFSLYRKLCAKMPPKSKAKSVSAECDLCCQQFEKDNEKLKCEGACGAVAHRYCAGVIRAHFDKIHKGQATFVCQYCELSLSKAVHQQLQSELQALKEQLTEVKRVLQTDSAADRITGIQDLAMPAATAPLANLCDNSETPALATEFQALRKEFDALRAVIDGSYNPRSYMHKSLLVFIAKEAKGPERKHKLRTNSSSSRGLHLHLHLLPLLLSVLLIQTNQ